MWVRLAIGICFVLVIVLIIAAALVFTNPHADLDRTLAHTNDPISSFAISPDWTDLAVGTLQEGFEMWDMQTGAMRYTLDPGNVRAIAFAPDGAIVALFWKSNDQTTYKIELRQVEDGKLIRFMNSGEWTSSLAFTPDGKQLVSAESHSVKLWDISNGTLVKTISVEGWDIAVSPNGRYLAIGGVQIELRDLESGDVLYSLPGWYFVTFSPDGKLLAAPASVNGADVQLWQTDTGQSFQMLQPDISIMSQVHSLAFSPDSSTLAIGTESRTVELMEVSTGKHIRTLHLGTNNGADGLDYSPDGKTLAVQTFFGGVQIWNLDK